MPNVEKWAVEDFLEGEEKFPLKSHGKKIPLENLPSNSSYLWPDLCSGNFDVRCRLFVNCTRSFLIISDMFNVHQVDYCSKQMCNQ